MASSRVVSKRTELGVAAIADPLRAKSQVGPGNDINAGSLGLQKAPTRALPAWSPRIVIGHGVFLLEQGYCLLGRGGSLWSCRLLVANASWWVEGIFDGLPCVEPHCLAGRNFNTLPRLWIPPVARRPCRHIESAEAGDSYRLSGYEGFENGLYYRLHRFGCCCLG
jgi:hypothetical protein